MGMNEFLEKNKREVNETLVKSFAICSLAIVALIVVDLMGIFHFSSNLKVIIIVAGFAATLGPFVMYKLKVNDRFLRYYMFIALSVVIGLMGTNNGIGIYITYILVPLCSCMYLDRWFTVRIGIIAYITMVFGVYFNTANKLEVRFLGWSHQIAFRNYMIGFTIEYLVVMVFMFALVKRSQKHLEEHEYNYQVLEEEYERQKEISETYDYAVPRQRRTTYDVLLKDSQHLTPASYTRIAAGHQFVSKINDMLMYSKDFSKAFNLMLAEVGEYFGLDRILYIEPTIENGVSQLSYQWAREKKDYITDYLSEMSVQQYEDIANQYADKGYFEIRKDVPFEQSMLQEIPSDFSHYVYDKCLGVELWMPIVMNGVYSGAVCFDKYDTEPYSAVVKFLLMEVVSAMGSHRERANADAANKAKSNFLSTMSHEIRTPMNAILGMTTVAMRSEMDDNVRKCLGIIRSSAEGLLGIINDILDFSKIESGKIDIIPEEYKAANLVNDLKTMVSARNVEKGLTIHYEISENLPTSLYGDMVRIKQVMVNFATNAIKYTNDGTVTISISMKKEKGCDLLCYSVADTGQGIKDEDKKYLFHSFAQVNQGENHHEEGTGLGLAISKQLIELMDGTIGFSSEYGKGSTFYFELPQKIMDATPIGDVDSYSYSEMEEETITFDGRGKKILIVDDNEINLYVAESLFEPFGMEITTSLSGPDALLKCMKETYDLILMDNFMPEMDGVETTHAIRGLRGNANQNVPIIALTADAVNGVRERLIGEGMNDFISKPIEMKDAVRIFKTYLTFPMNNSK